MVPWGPQEAAQKSPQGIGTDIATGGKVCHMAILFALQYSCANGKATRGSQAHSTYAHVV
eukprot:4840262-Karenia_brevis.AAC.1